jgi:hypothetical protein
MTQDEKYTEQFKKALNEYIKLGFNQDECNGFMHGFHKGAEAKQLILSGVSNRLEEDTCAKAAPLIIEMNKDHLVELYNFAYEQAVKTGKVDELKEIDSKLNGC